jgi:hypothetical protein
MGGGGGQNAFGQGMPKGGMGGSPMQQNAMLQPGMAGSFQGQQQGANNMWHGFEVPMVDGQSPSDSWSTSSVHGQVPATLNVEDW